MEDSKWSEFDMERMIREILADSKYNTDHPFGRPFLTPYQIAIELLYRYPNILEQLEMQFGGKGTIDKKSLSRYIAHQLGTRIQDGRIHGIEGRFLSNDFLIKLSYKKPDGNEVEAANRGKEYLSMYRIP
jgi:hypothetical protein